MVISNPQISQDALLRLANVRAMIGMGKTLIYRLIKNNQFPRQIHPAGSRMSAWRQSEIETWIDEQARMPRDLPVSPARQSATRRRR